MQMRHSIAFGILTVTFAAAGGAPAFAQTTVMRPAPAIDRPVFVDIGGGVATNPGALDTGTTFTIFGENGSAATRIEPGTSGMVDLRVGYRGSRHLGVAAAVSGSQSSVPGSTTASIPSPIRFASPTIVSLDAVGAKRREIGVHVQALYSLEIADRMIVTIAGGPSIVHLQQGVPNVDVNGGTPTVVSANESGNGIGGNAGVDLSRSFSTRYGAGVFVRYVAAHVDLPSASSVKAGGVQVGAGFRIRF
jgi:hypothetical protein